MKLQLYTSQQHAETPRQPSPISMEDAGAPAKAAAGALAQMSSDIGDWAKTQGELVKREREAAAYVDAVKAETEFGAEVDTEDTRMRSADGYDYKTHADAINQKGQEILERHAEQLQDPEAARRFRVSAMRSLAERVSKTRYEARTRAAGEMDAANLTKIRQTEIEAAAAPSSALRQAKLQAMEAETRELAKRGWITPEQAGTRIDAMYENVETAEVRAILADPNKEPMDVIRHLQGAEAWTKIRSTRRAELVREAARTITARATTRAKADADAEKQAKIDAAAFMSQVAREADPTFKGERMSDEVFESGMSQMAGTPSVGFDTMRAVRAARARPAIDGGVSTPGAVERWKTRILSADPTATAKAILDDMGAGRNLSGKDGNELLDILKRETTEKGVTSTEEWKIGKEQITLIVGKVNPTSSLMGPMGGFMNDAQAGKLAAALSRYYDVARAVFEGRDKQGRSVSQLKSIAIQIAKEYEGGSGDSAAGPSGSSSTGTGLPKGVPRTKPGSASKQTQ